MSKVISDKDMLDFLLKKKSTTRTKVEKELIAYEASQCNCPICLDNIEEKDELIFKPCLHKLHSQCAKEFISREKSQTSIRCPICRTKIVVPKTLKSVVGKKFTIIREDIEDDRRMARRLQEQSSDSSDDGDTRRRYINIGVGIYTLPPRAGVTNVNVKFDALMRSSWVGFDYVMSD